MDGLHANIPFDEGNSLYALQQLPPLSHHESPLFVPHVSPHTASFIAGGLSSSVRWALIPLEVVKTRMQVEATSFSTCLTTIYRNEGLRGLGRGLAPTAMAYGVQTSAKYGFYDLYKERMNNSFSSPYVASAISAGLAEMTADILMCPWEMIKAKMQTTADFPRRLVPAVMEMTRHSRIYDFPFGALKPLWMRQIPGTMVNFCMFERTAESIYQSLGVESPSELTMAQQLGVTFAAGSAAGIVSAIVSHPADSIISLMGRQPTLSMTDIIREHGFYRLATCGLLPRVVITSHIICGQWLLYRSIKGVLLSENDAVA